MKRFPAWILVFPLFSQGAAISVGGVIAPIHSVICGGNPAADFSKDGDNVVIATCTVDENEPSFQESFHFGLGDIRSPGVTFTSLTFHGMNGSLGQGLEAPRGQDVLPSLQDGILVWAPGPQRSATVAYVVEFRASWKTDAANFGAPGLLITAISGAGD